MHSSELQINLFFMASLSFFLSLSLSASEAYFLLKGN